MKDDLGIIISVRSLLWRLKLSLCDWRENVFSAKYCCDVLECDKGLMSLWLQDFIFCEFETLSVSICSELCTSCRSSIHISLDISVTKTFSCSPKSTCSSLHSQACQLACIVQVTPSFDLFAHSPAGFYLLPGQRYFDDLFKNTAQVCSTEGSKLCWICVKGIGPDLECRELILH